MRGCHTAITSGADTGVCLSDVRERLTKLLHNLGSRVVRAIVHDDQLQVRVGLGQDGGNRFPTQVARSNVGIMTLTNGGVEDGTTIRALY